mgnify:CR=1 FL=1
MGTTYLRLRDDRPTLKAILDIGYIEVGMCDNYYLMRNNQDNIVYYDPKYDMVLPFLEQDERLDN